MTISQSNARLTGTTHFHTSVGRTPSSALDPLVQLFDRKQRPTRASAADLWVRPPALGLLHSDRHAIGGDSANAERQSNRIPD